MSTPIDKKDFLPEVKEDLLDAVEHPTNGPGYCREELASAKIQPLESREMKYNQGHEHTHGVIGEDWTFQNTHLEPLPHGGLKHGPQGKEGGHHGGHHQRRDEHLAGMHGQPGGQEQMKTGGERMRQGEGSHTSDPDEYAPMVHMQD